MNRLLTPLAMLSALFVYAETSAQTFTSTDTPLRIPPTGSGGGDSANPDNNTRSTISISGVERSVTDLNVTINLTHTFDSDLEISLEHLETGTLIDLSSGNGGTGDDYIDTIFDDEAATSITAGTAPFTGSFIPEEPLSSFDGELLNGDWVLNIFDDAGGDTGELAEWSLIFESEPIFTPVAPPRAPARSDLLIGKSFSRLKGNNRYDKNRPSNKQTLTRGARIFTTNTANASLLMQNDGGTATSFQLKSKGDQLPRMKVTARVKGGKNITADLKRGGYKTMIAPGESVQVSYSLKTNRFFAGVLRGGDRNDTVQFTLSGGGSKDNATMVVKYRGPAGPPRQ